MDHSISSGGVTRGQSGAAPYSTHYLPPRDWLFYAVAATLLAYVWRVQDLFPVLATLKFVPMVSLAMIGLFILDRDPRRSLPGVKHQVTFYATVVLVLMVLSVPGSLYPGLSFGLIVHDHIKTFMLMVLLAASIRTVRDVERFAVVQVLGMGIYSILIIWRYDIGMSGRLGNLVYYDANDLGMLIICTLPLAIYFLRREAAWYLRAMTLVVLPITLMTIVKTGSRGAFLGLLAVSIYMLVGFRAFTRQARIGAGLAAVMLLLLIGNETYWSMMQTLLHPQEDYNWVGGAPEGRMEIWKRGMGYMLMRPLLGVGAGAFPVAEGTISQLAQLQEYGIGLKWSSAHNSFVQIGAELGIPGLLSFVLLLTTAFFACIRIGRGGTGDGESAANAAAMGQALCSTLVGYAVAGFFLSQAYAVYFYATLGIVVGLVRVTASAGATSAGAVPPAPIPRGFAHRTGVAPSRRPRSGR
jgi:O-antigen ligase